MFSATLFPFQNPSQGKNTIQDKKKTISPPTYGKAQSSAPSNTQEVVVRTHYEVLLSGTADIAAQNGPGRSRLDH
jgi:hypothetical protein